MPRWWEEGRYRLVQLNLRESDASLDVPGTIAWLREIDANVLMIGMGGIRSFYPAAQPSQLPAAGLDGDLFGRLLAAAHSAGIRVIARFDFSKLDRSCLAAHPDWFVLTPAGGRAFYGTTAATCVNGGYQQEEIFAVLADALERYPVDGIFFNMFGYQTHDYDGRWFGACRCAGCLDRVRGRYGAELPQPGPDEAPDPRLVAFRRETVRELLERIQALVRRIRPEAAVCTYARHGVDLVRDEANSAVDRAWPRFLESARRHSERIRWSWPGRYASNCAINAVDIPYRYQGVDPAETRLRLLQALASGASLDWCIIGAPQSYPDPRVFDDIRAIFSYHRRNAPRLDRILENLWQPRLALVDPGDCGDGDSERAFRGWYRALREAHRPFRIIEAAALDERDTAILDGVALLILPDLLRTPAAIPAHAAAGGRLLATGRSLLDRPDLLHDICGATAGETAVRTRGSYVTAPAPSDAARWLYVDGPLRCLEPSAAAASFCFWSGPGVYGPPELCANYDAFRRPPHGPATVTLLPGRGAALGWCPDRLYDRDGYRPQAQLLLSLVDRLLADLPRDCPLLAGPDLPPEVALSVAALAPGHWLCQLVNLGGWNGQSCHDAPRLAPVSLLVPEHRVSRLLDCGNPWSAENGLRLAADGRRIWIEGLHRHAMFELWLEPV